MNVTAIKQQVKRAGRYSIFVDGKYSFSLSADGLLDSKVVVGLEVDDKRIREFKQLSDDDKIYNNVLGYLAIRPRSQWEIQSYLQRKKASPTLSSAILNKLSDNDLINDQKFAQAFVNDRRLLKPTSRRKLSLELRQKRISTEVINRVLAGDEVPDSDVLQELITRKRRQTKYQDDLKLMQYLARQGFNYNDIKDALATASNAPDNDY